MGVLRGGLDAVIAAVAFEEAIVCVAADNARGGKIRSVSGVFRTHAAKRALPPMVSSREGGEKSSLKPIFNFELKALFKNLS